MGAFVSEMGGRACLIGSGIYLHTHSYLLNIYWDLYCELIYCGVVWMGAFVCVRVQCEEAFVQLPLVEFTQALLFKLIMLLDVK